MTPQLGFSQYSPDWRRLPIGGMDAQIATQLRLMRFLDVWFLDPKYTNGRTAGKHIFIKQTSFAMIMSLTPRPSHKDLLILKIPKILLVNQSFANFQRGQLHWVLPKNLTLNSSSFLFQKCQFHCLNITSEQFGCF